MAEKNKSNDKLTIAALIIILAAVLYFVYIFAAGIKPAPPSADHSLQPFVLVNPQIISAVKELNACGAWPLIAVGLSAERGNPFDRKSAALPAMSATSSVSCLPVTQ